MKVLSLQIKNDKMHYGDITAAYPDIINGEGGGFPQEGEMDRTWTGMQLKLKASLNISILNEHGNDVGDGDGSGDGDGGFGGGGVTVTHRSDGWGAANIVLPSVMSKNRF